MTHQFFTDRPSIVSSILSPYAARLAPTASFLFFSSCPDSYARRRLSTSCPGPPCPLHRSSSALLLKRSCAFPALLFWFPACIPARTHLHSHPHPSRLHIHLPLAHRSRPSPACIRACPPACNLLPLPACIRARLLPTDHVRLPPAVVPTLHPAVVPALACIRARARLHSCQRSPAFAPVLPLAICAPAPPAFAPACIHPGVLYPGDLHPESLRVMRWQKIRASSAKLSPTYSHLLAIPTLIMP